MNDSRNVENSNTDIEFMNVEATNLNDPPIEWTSDEIQFIQYLLLDQQSTGFLTSRRDSEPISLDQVNTIYNRNWLPSLQRQSNVMHDNIATLQETKETHENKRKAKRQRSLSAPSRDTQQDDDHENEYIKKMRREVSELEAQILELQSALQSLIEVNNNKRSVDEAKVKLLEELATVKSIQKNIQNDAFCRKAMTKSCRELQILPWTISQHCTQHQISNRHYYGWEIQSYVDESNVLRYSHTKRIGKNDPILHNLKATNWYLMQSFKHCFQVQQSRVISKILKQVHQNALVVLQDIICPVNNIDRVIRMLNLLFHRDVSDGWASISCSINPNINKYRRNSTQSGKGIHLRQHQLTLDNETPLRWLDATFGCIFRKEMNGTGTLTHVGQFYCSTIEEAQCYDLEVQLMTKKWEDQIISH